jgi:hypothetical protein
MAILLLAGVTSCSGGGGTTSSSSAPEPLIRGTADNTGAVAFPAPSADKVAALTQSAGLQLEQKESLVHHVHAHLDVYIDGEHRTIPPGIGIVSTDAGVHVDELEGQPTYGGIELCNAPCISPLHTHAATGVIHTESAIDEDITLGQFFKEWDVRLDDTCVGDFCTPQTPITLYVDGTKTPLEGASSIVVSDQKEIALVIGTPPSRVPNQANFDQP